MNVIDTVGGSIGCAWIGVSTLGSQKVSATVALGRPAMATMSPASASSTACARCRGRRDLGDAAGLDQLAVADRAP
jgi:cytochrome c553